MIPRGEVALTASPNPIPAGEGLGTTTITWSTGDGSVGRVFVSRDDEPESDFAVGPEGTKEAPWINAGSRYEFRLYVGVDRSSPRASVTVTRDTMNKNPGRIDQWPAEGNRGIVDPSKQPNEAVQEAPDWHRRAVGGMWEEMGRLQFDFLLAQGLQPQHYLLDVGCGSLRGGRHFISYLEPGHYYGVDKEQWLLDAGLTELQAANLQDREPHLSCMDDFAFERLDQTFDYALAQSVFTHLSLNSIIRCLVNIDRTLRPGGVFFATFFENSGGKQNLEPITQSDIVVSYYDSDPYHYTRDALVWACEGTALEAEYVGDWQHPHQQVMMAFRKTAV